MKTKICILLLTLGIIAAWIVRAETVPQSQTVLDSYFVTGAVPTQNDYDELIDTMFWYVNSTYTNSQVAASNATVAVANNPATAEGLYILTNNTPFAFAQRLVNITNVVVTKTVVSAQESDWAISNNFVTPMPDTNYVFTPLGTGASFTNMLFTLVTTTNCIIKVQQAVQSSASHLSYPVGFIICR